MRSGGWIVKIVMCLGSLCVAAVILGIGLFLSQSTGFFGVLNSENQKLLGYVLVGIGMFITFFSFSYFRIDKPEGRSKISVSKFNKILYIIPTILLLGVFIYIFSIDMKDKAQYESQENSPYSVEEQLYGTR